MFTMFTSVFFCIFLHLLCHILFCFNTLSCAKCLKVRFGRGKKIHLKCLAVTDVPYFHMDVTAVTRLSQLSTRYHCYHLAVTAVARLSPLSLDCHCSHQTLTVLTRLFLLPPGSHCYHHASTAVTRLRVMLPGCHCYSRLSLLSPGYNYVNPAVTTDTRL